MSRIGYQGEPGAYGEEAVIGYFGDAGIEPVPMPTFSAVCAAVEDGTLDGAVLPLENSIAGTVGDALDALARGALRVVGELLLPVRHQLLVMPGASLEGVRRVASHWQALGQCERFLAARAWAVVAAADTAGAARDLAAGGWTDMAVVASERAASRYGLEVAARDIADASDNVTRFAVLAPGGEASPLPAGGMLAPRGATSRETLLTFETGHRPGDLYRALGALAERGVNLSRIESRPSGAGAWRYRFLLQVSGDAAADPLADALTTLQLHTVALRILGSFDVATGDH